MSNLRPILALTLALVVALTSGVMAVARGQTVSAGSIVLCTGTGPVSVQVDANGTPIGPVHICPDCALNLLDVAMAEPKQVSLVSVAHRIDLPRRKILFGSFAVLVPRARAPPIS